MSTTTRNSREAVSAEATAARMRAARAFAGLSQAAVAQLLGVSTVTVKRIEAGTRPCSSDELFAVADACGVPRDFMTDGFSMEPGDPLHAEIAGLHARFDVLEGVLSQSVADVIARNAAGSVRKPAAAARRS